MLIHAGLATDGPFLRKAPRRLPYGGFVGVAIISGFVTESEDEWFSGPLGIVMERAMPLPFKRYPGQLGLFMVNREALGAWLDYASAYFPSE